MSRQRLQNLYVYMNNQCVGTLIRRHAAALSFIYANEWLENSQARPISLSMPLREQAYEDDRVYNFFDNLLPDNESLRTRIQQRFNTNSTTCFDLLSHIGADCIGAFQLLAEPINERTDGIIATPMTAMQVAERLRNYQQAPLGMALDSDFRISIAGAQEKMAFLKYQNQWCSPEKHTPTTHIFKLPIGKIGHSGIDLSDSVENEWLCLQIVSEYGLPVNNAEIANFENLKILICERFDRKWNAARDTIFRLPQEDLCQAFGISAAIKYEAYGAPGITDIMGFLQGSYQAIDDRKMFFKACFISWILGAIDGHAKNFSVHIKPGGRFCLTPLYDVMSAYPLADDRQLEWKKLKMAMSVRGKNKHYSWSDIQLRHWRSTAVLAHMPESQLSAIIAEVIDDMESIIDKVSSRLPENFPAHIAESIFNGMRKVKERVSNS